MKKIILLAAVVLSGMAMSCDVVRENDKAVADNAYFNSDDGFIPIKPPKPPTTPPPPPPVVKG